MLLYLLRNWNLFIFSKNLYYNLWRLMTCMLPSEHDKMKALPIRRRHGSQPHQIYARDSFQWSRIHLLIAGRLHILVQLKRLCLPGSTKVSGVTNLAALILFWKITQKLFLKANRNNKFIFILVELFIYL